MNRLLIKFLVRQLYLANRTSHAMLNFYDRKEYLLARYSIFDGFDVQHIVRKCWCCNAGRTNIMSNGEGEKCFTCNGTGIKEESNSVLSRWKLGDSIFHNFVEKHSVDVDLSYLQPRNLIEGIVPKKSILEPIDIEAHIWICLFATGKLPFWNKIPYWQAKKGFRYPLSTIILLMKRLRDRYVS
ncbi:MAG: hypothetical protein V1775_02220 [Bacteroidota bacterium]